MFTSDFRRKSDLTSNIWLTSTYSSIQVSHEVIHLVSSMVVEKMIYIYPQKFNFWLYNTNIYFPDTKRVACIMENKSENFSIIACQYILLLAIMKLMPFRYNDTNNKIKISSAGCVWKRFVLYFCRTVSECEQRKIIKNILLFRDRDWFQIKYSHPVAYHWQNKSIFLSDKVNLFNRIRKFNFMEN